jgi:hypothetical protein
VLFSFGCEIHDVDCVVHLLYSFPDIMLSLCDYTNLDHRKIVTP